MHIEITSHRNAIEIAENNVEFSKDYKELLNILNLISDDDILNEFSREIYQNNKSISRSINQLIKDKLINAEWYEESPIFQTPDYSNNRFRLDFAKNNFALEVAFNHGEAISWNLLKPVLSSELNHVNKAIQTKIGIIIFATNEMKKAGGFDSAVGSYEKALKYLPIMMNQLTVPLIIIGLKKPQTFKIEPKRNIIRF